MEKKRHTTSLPPQFTSTPRPTRNTLESLKNLQTSFTGVSPILPVNHTQSKISVSLLSPAGNNVRKSNVTTNTGLGNKLSSDVQNIFKDAELSANYLDSWKVPPKTKKAFSLKRKSNLCKDREVEKINVPNQIQEGESGLFDNTNDELSPIEISYPPKKRKKTNVISEKIMEIGKKSIDKNVDTKDKGNNKAVADDHETSKNREKLCSPEMNTGFDYDNAERPNLKSTSNSQNTSEPISSNAVFEPEQSLPKRNTQRKRIQATTVKKTQKKDSKPMPKAEENNNKVVNNKIDLKVETNLLQKNTVAGDKQSTGEKKRRGRPKKGSNVANSNDKNKISKNPNSETIVAEESRNNESSVKQNATVNMTRKYRKTLLKNEESEKENIDDLNNHVSKTKSLKKNTARSSRKLAVEEDSKGEVDSCKNKQISLNKRGRKKTPKRDSCEPIDKSINKQINTDALLLQGECKPSSGSISQSTEIIVKPKRKAQKKCLAKPLNKTSKNKLIDDKYENLPKENYNSEDQVSQPLREVKMNLIIGQTHSLSNSNNKTKANDLSSIIPDRRKRKSDITVETITGNQVNPSRSKRVPHDVEDAQDVKGNQVNPSRSKRVPHDVEDAQDVKGNSVTTSASQAAKKSIERVFYYKDCFPNEKPVETATQHPGVKMTALIHKSNYLLIGYFTFEAGASITKSSTSTSYSVVEGTASVSVNIGSRIHVNTITPGDNGHFFIPKQAVFSIQNEGCGVLRLHFTKFKD